MKSGLIGTQLKQEDETLWLGKLGASWLIHRRNPDEPELLKIETETDSSPAYYPPSRLRFADP